MSAHTLNPYRAGLWTTGMARMLQALGLAMAGLVLTACERPSPESVQSGYRGTGMVQVYNVRLLEAKTEKNQAPVAIPSPGSDGPKAAQVYKNVKVLGHLSAGEFNRLMVSIRLMRHARAYAWPTGRRASCANAQLTRAPSPSRPLARSRLHPEGDAAHVGLRRGLL